MQAQESLKGVFVQQCSAAETEQDQEAWLKWLDESGGRLQQQLAGFGVEPTLLAATQSQLETSGHTWAD